MLYQALSLLELSELCLYALCFLGDSYFLHMYLYFIYVITLHHSIVTLNSVSKSKTQAQFFHLFSLLQTPTKISDLG